MPSDKNKYIAWQIRVDHPAADIIEKIANKEMRSINKTILRIIYEYLQEHPELTDPQSQTKEFN